METTQAPPAAYNGLKSSGTETAATESGSRQLSSDFETFLRMLTVQMQNQDPLNPVDSSDYAVQLATFSSVEQQVLTNDLLRALGTQMGGGTLGQLAGWVGMEALARAPVAYEGSPVHLRPEYAARADAATLVVRASDGTIVARETLKVGQETYEWSGKDGDGAALPAGTYRFDVESYQNGTLLDTKMAQVYSRVQEARLSGETILLRLSDGTEVESNLVEGMRAPD